jgi:hypothetical protein
MTQGFQKERSAMVNKPNSDAAKNILWPGATPFLALLSRQNPFGLRGSLPATANWLRGRLFVFCRVSCKRLLANIRWQLLPEPSGKSCQNSRAVLAIDPATKETKEGSCYAAA